MLVQQAVCDGLDAIVTFLWIHSMTGVTDAKTLEVSPVRPDYVLQSIADLEGLLREGGFDI